MSSPASSVSKATTRKKAAPAREAPATPRKPAAKKPLTDADIYPHQEVLLYDPQPKQIRIVRQDGMTWFSANDVLRIIKTATYNPCFRREVIKLGRVREIITYDPATERCYASHYVCWLGLQELLIRYGNNNAALALWAWIKTMVEQ